MNYSTLGSKFPVVRPVTSLALILGGLGAFVGNLGDMLTVVNDHSKTNVSANTLDHLRYSISHGALDAGGWFLHTGYGALAAFAIALGIVHAINGWRDGETWGWTSGLTIGIGVVFTFLFGLFGYMASVSNGDNAGNLKGSWVVEHFGTNQSVLDPNTTQEKGDDGNYQYVYHPSVFSGKPIGSNETLYYKVYPVFNSSGDVIGSDISRVSKDSAQKLRAAYKKAADE